MTAAWRILHLGCPCLASPIMAGSKLFPPKSETRPPTKLPRCRSAAFSDREQVDKPASLDGKGRPSCHERPLTSTLGYPARGPAGEYRPAERLDGLSSCPAICNPALRHPRSAGDQIFGDNRGA